jgi:3-oxoacyl-[acyl-carrier-protein] synthase II
MALSGAELSQESVETGDPELGLVCGTVFGSVHSITSFDWSGVSEGPTYVNPMEFANTVINAPAGQAAIKHKLRGVNSTVCAGLASGLHAIHYAAEFLRFGRARALLAGGVEELCEESVLGFRQSGAVVPGEGAALWMLEIDDAAQARGRVPWLEVCGFGSVHGDGAAATMEQALANSDISPEQVACIVVSSNGSRAGDELEARALNQVFGERLANVPRCAPKAAFGEAMGASGALCAIAAGLALQQQNLPPTAGSVDLDGPLGLSATTVSISGDYALVNAFGSDGNNASLVVRLWKN